MKKILILIFSMFSFVINAKEERIVITDSTGIKAKIGIESYYNQTGVLEVRVDAAGIPKLVDKLNPTIAFGRDLNGDQKIDTWFFITKNGIETERLQGEDPLGRDILARLIFKKHQTSAGLYLASATTTILNYLLITASVSNAHEAEYINNWINLEEIKIRFEDELNSPNNSQTREQIEFHYNLLSFGYKNLANDMEKFAKRDFWGWASADVALWLSGSIILKWTARILIKSTGIIAENLFFATVKDNFASFITNHLNILKEKSSIINTKLFPITEKTVYLKNEALFKLTQLNLKNAVSTTLSSHIAKDRILQISKISLKWPINIVKGAISEWQYIALNGSIQLASETTARWDEVYDSNPLKMAKNVLTNQDILQNIGFMTADTVLMTGLSKNLKSTKAKFIASGFVGMTDSTLINLVIKKEENYKRIALDTGWESVIGNAQVQLDLKALETFEKMAIKKSNPRLKLLGYAVVLIDQGVGYYVYSKASTNPALGIKLLPVMAEQ